MNTLDRTTAEQVKEFCALIGTDPLLVQGAGGNVSWKDGNVLWVKASGTWLAHAALEEIFLPVDLGHLREHVGKGEFSVKPILLNQTKLRPSIETFLHALLDHEVVVHLHAVEIMAHLIRDDWITAFNSLLGNDIEWITVDYYKPGADLAKAISIAVNKSRNANVIFLQNHGVIIGAKSVEEVGFILNKLISKLKTKPNISNAELIHKENINFVNNSAYQMIADIDLQNLALNPNLFNRLKTEWALCPDHIVFLGPSPYLYNHPSEILATNCVDDQLPKLAFIKGVGVFAQKDITAGQKLQLRFYYDVLIRQCENTKINVLNEGQIGDLLNWDAEIYRRSISI
jgi:rhamnose utilization protein RhaD (predicted bifunctional aldolase and dehydrogenase)